MQSIDSALSSITPANIQNPKSLNLSGFKKREAS